MSEVILWGGAGQARVLNECLVGSGYKIVAVFDNSSVAPPLPDVPFHVGKDGFRAWMTNLHGRRDPYFAVAVGGPDRLAIHDWLVEEGLRPLTVVHRAAYLAVDATLGPGCQILAHATVCTQARLGRSVIVTGAVILPRLEIGDDATIGAGAVVVRDVPAGAVAMGVPARMEPPR
jgi:acyl-[acyl carrier protein]--UDP-N-acetylglucosamine O-acyltransferase